MRETAMDGFRKCLLRVALVLMWVFLIWLFIVGAGRAEDAKKPDPPKAVPITLTDQERTELQALQWRSQDIDARKKQVIEQLFGKEDKQYSDDAKAIAARLQEKYKIVLNGYTVDLTSGVLTPRPVPVETPPASNHPPASDPKPATKTEAPAKKK